MSVLGKVGKFLSSPKVIGNAIGGLPGLAAGALFDQKRGQFRKNRSLIQEAYQGAQARQMVHEGDVRQGTAESLTARGLGTAGAVNPAASKIASAMGATSGYLTPSTTLGQRQQAEDSRELAFDRHDLDSAYQRSLNENKTDYINNLISTGVGAVKTAASLGGAGGGGGIGVGDVTQQQPSTSQASIDAIASQSVPGVQYAAPRIASAMGVDDPSNWWGGIHGIRPLDAPGSNWNSKETLSASPGTPNSEFHL